MKKLAFIFLILSGCGLFKNPQGEWYKPGGSTLQELANVRYICLQESQQLRPSSSNQTIIVQNYPTNPSQRESEALLEGFRQGMNAHHAEKGAMVTNEHLFDACMNAHGFFWHIIE